MGRRHPQLLAPDPDGRERGLLRDGTPRGEPSAHLPPTAFVSFLQNHDQVGNRAFGERLSELVDPKRLSLARALFLLAPQIPLLFQGEDWAATSPFLFFVDFESDPDLEKAVREGRRREFSHFAAFADPDTNARIPDPTSRDTFERSRIDWAEAGREPHAAARKETAELLRLRQREIVPLLQSSFGGGTYKLPDPQSLDVRWTFGAGSLRLLANFGDTAQSFEAAGLRPIWISPEARQDGEALHLPPWTGAILKGENR
jgi:maltooligosyltrehalose trehalohydrolase